MGNRPLPWPPKPKSEAASNATLKDGQISSEGTTSREGIVGWGTLEMVVTISFPLHMNSCPNIA